MKDLLEDASIAARVFIFVFTFVFMITLPIYAALKAVVYLLGDL